MGPELSVLEFLVGELVKVILTELSPNEGKALVDRVFAQQVNLLAEQMEKEKFGKGPPESEEQ